MAIKYCEFEPTQHRNKRVAFAVFLDEPDDPHPLAICDVCAKKLLQMRPDAIVMPRKEFEAQKKAKKGAAGDAKPAEEGAESAPEPAPESEPEAHEGETAEADEPEPEAGEERPVENS